jgi:hypothetical protein
MGDENFFFKAFCVVAGIRGLVHIEETRQYYERRATQQKIRMEMQAQKLQILREIAAKMALLRRAI